MLVVGLGILLMVAAGIALVGGTLHWYYELIVALAWVLPGPFAVIGTALLFIVAFGYSLEHYKKIRKSTPATHGFVGLVTQKVKSKTCFMINFTKDSK
jgi:hypothetical protein